MMLKKSLSEHATLPHNKLYTKPSPKHSFIQKKES